MPIPNYFSRMKQVNIKGPVQSANRERPSLLSTEQLKKRSNTDLVVDLRRPDDFAAGNIQGSINLPFNLSLSLWAGTILPDDKELILVVDHQQMIIPAIQTLGLVGLDNISGIVNVSDWSPVQKQELLIPSPSMSVETLMDKKNDFYLLDVRNRNEWDAGHIEGANLVELTRFPKAISEIPVDKPIAVICHSGNRASIIASLLRKERGAKTFNVKGGMAAWNKANATLASMSN